jgi:polysaccharide deacetylase family protein (PEP-CTERM system associated)
MSDMPAGDQSPKMAMTIDVEDYFQVAAFKDVISPAEWDSFPPRVEQNTRRLLELFSREGITATFFVLGWVAERMPGLVREIQTDGHEIASHGYSHQLIFEQSPEVFRRETAKSKAILEDITGEKVRGYRAASYSVTRDSLWALDILAELGFTWDSSIFPVHHDTYGMAGTPDEPYQLITPSGAALTEFPLTTARVLGLSVPAAGGGYFRQYPYALSRWLLARASRYGEKPTIFYLHPWEVDPDQPRIPNASSKSRFRHYTNLSRCLGRLERLCQDFQFGTVDQVLSSCKIDRSFYVSTEELVWM